MFGREKRISLDSVDMKNRDLFVKKSGTKLHKRAELIVDDTHSAILFKHSSNKTKFVSPCVNITKFFL